MPPEALREDACRLDRRRAVQVGDDRYLTNRVAPGPAAARRVVLGLADDVRDAEDRLPDGGVEDRTVAGLNGRPFRRPLRSDSRCVDATIERLLASATNEQPLGHADLH
jgi:hypothetical protein